MSSTGRSKHRKLNKKAERLLAEKEAATLLQAQRLQQATTAVQGGMLLRVSSECLHALSLVTSAPPTSPLMAALLA